MKTHGQQMAQTRGMNLCVLLLGMTTLAACQDARYGSAAAFADEEAPSGTHFSTQDFDCDGEVDLCTITVWDEDNLSLSERSDSDCDGVPDDTVCVANHFDGAGNLVGLEQNLGCDENTEVIFSASY